MIQMQNVTKSFGRTRALADISLEIPEGTIFGLLGTNGAGKSTLLRILSGVLSPDTGTVQIDGMPVFENPERKESLFYISDEVYFFPNATAEEMASFYRTAYPAFDINRFHRLMMQFSLDPKSRIQTYSKGMRKQLFLILGLSAGTKYLFCDETFDGLDPVIRQAVKSLLAGEVLERKFTPVIASHNLREMEDICSRVGLLHGGGILLSKDIEQAQQETHKVQCVIPQAGKEEEMLHDLKVQRVSRQGSLLVFTARGNQEEIQARIQEAQPLFMEVLPLSLEEIFISETEVAGYEIPKGLF